MIALNHLEKYTENNRIEAKKALGGIILLGVEEYKDKTLHTVNLPDPESLVKEFWAAVNNQDKVSVNLLTGKHICSLPRSACNRKRQGQ